MEFARPPLRQRRRPRRGHSARADRGVAQRVLTRGPSSRPTRWSRSTRASPRPGSPGTGTAAYTKLRGAVGTGIRPPDGFELAFTNNPGLRPERSVSAEGGDRSGVRRRTRARRSDGVFQRVRRPDRDSWIVQRIESLYQRQHLERPRSRARAGPDASRARRRAPRRGPQRPRRLHVARHGGARGRSRRRRAAAILGRAGAPATAEAPVLRGRVDRRARRSRSSFEAAAAARRSTSSRPSAPSAACSTAPGYQVWHAGASWRVVRLVEVFGRVENLFDRGYEEAFGFPALGRRATAGLRIAAGR